MQLAREARYYSLVASRNYSDLSKDELIRLPEARDRALSQDLVALDLDPALSAGVGPWRNLIIEGDNFHALRYLCMTFTCRVRCVYIDPPYNADNDGRVT
ncbi:MAG: hypothetical protein ACREBE_15580 [bacterium]